MMLTRKVVDAAKRPTQGQVFVRDVELRGFALRITPGSKTFILEKEINGRVQRMTLGRYGALTVDQARDLTKVKIGAIANIELDYEGGYLRPACRDGAAGSPTNANRMVALVRHMFNCAADWGLFTGANPATRIKLFKERSRDRFVTQDELPRLWAALQREPNPYVRGTFFIGLLTGARRSGVLGMRWSMSRNPGNGSGAKPILRMSGFTISGEPWGRGWSRREPVYRYLGRL